MDDVVERRPWTRWPRAAGAWMWGTERRDAVAWDDDNKEYDEYGTVPMASVNMTLPTQTLTFAVSISLSRSSSIYADVRPHCSIWTILSINFGFSLLFQSVWSAASMVVTDACLYYWCAWTCVPADL